MKIKTKKPLYRYLSPYDAVMDNVERDGDCLLYTGTVNRGGYGHLTWGGRPGRSLRAHRVVAARHLGPPPPGKPFVLHSCGNRACVEITHLRYGTAQDNMDDRNAGGRYHRPMWPHRVNLIRQRRAAGEAIDDIARAYGVTADTVRNICTGRTWASLPAKKVRRRSR